MQIIVNGVPGRDQGQSQHYAQANGKVLAIGGDSDDRNCWFRGTIDEVSFGVWPARLPRSRRTWTPRWTGS